MKKCGVNTQNSVKLDWMSYIHYEKRKMTKRHHKKLQMRPGEKVKKKVKSEKKQKIVAKKN